MKPDPDPPTVRRSMPAAFVGGTVIRTLGGLIGLGGNPAYLGREGLSARLIH